MELKDPALLKQFMDTGIDGAPVSARQVSRVAGWESHTYLQRLLRGEVKTLKTEPALRIAHFFGVPVDVLFLTRVSTDQGQTGHDQGAA